GRVTAAARTPRAIERARRAREGAIRGVALDMVTPRIGSLSAGIARRVGTGGTVVPRSGPSVNPPGNPFPTSGPSARLFGGYAAAVAGGRVRRATASVAPA